MREIYCIYLKKNAPGMERAPYPGELGEKIYASISKEAWQLWIKQQTILINENKFSMADAKSREFLRVEMEKFFFK
jgi:Fe-S cluster biosynthesis and repair protein YggX